MTSARSGNESPQHHTQTRPPRGASAPEADGPSGVRVGLLVDPDFPQQLAQALAPTLPDQLAAQLGDRGWSVQVVVDPVTAGQDSGREMLQTLQAQREQQDLDYAVCLTDLPLRHHGRPVSAEAGLNEGVALISLPALGLVQPYRRARQMLLQLLDDLTAATEQSQSQPEEHTAGTRRRRGLHSRLTNLLAPIRREQPDQGEVGIRYRATRWRGRLRLLSGMVRSNSPLRLIWGLSRALAAAIATSAFGLSSSTIWMLSHALPGQYHVLAAVASIAVLVLWLISAHGLWEHPRQSRDREQRWLYNSSTVATLTLGVAEFYLALYAINLAVAAFLVSPALLASLLQAPVTVGTYLSLAWGFTTMGIVAGALGSSLETETAVRHAAYGYRESQRRRTHQHHHQHEPTHHQ